tara:strand:+ start:1139 stop:1750 length:612 start_codon:yes stop_codon:yes gene_type:complete
MLKNEFSVSGRVTISVTDMRGTRVVSDKSNVIIQDAARILLAGIVPSTALSSDTQFPASDAGRPAVLAYSGGPSNRNSIAYMELGYVGAGAQVPEVTVSRDDIILAAADPELAAAATEYISISDVTLEDHSVVLTATKSVDVGSANNQYFEVGLKTSGADNPQLPPADDSATRLFAHQVHGAVTASDGATIQYQWTISINPPA